MKPQILLLAFATALMTACSNSGHTTFDCLTIQSINDLTATTNH